MSAVIKKTKKKYQLALSIELLIFITVFLVLLAVQLSNAVSFLLGTFAIFVPYCMFVFLMFFKTAKNTHQLTTFYRGGAIKFICTIILIVIAFKFFPTINYVVFFIGYFLALLLNNLLPVMVTKMFRI
ncbi:ATP synthase subunit I [Avibacterium endocarditidis]|uniref:ATP synthase subunit I n=1 Tax=Avibacterium endocarditidis TaxID=380674 RepID=UPI003BF7C700